MSIEPLYVQNYQYIYSQFSTLLYLEEKALSNQLPKVPQSGGSGDGGDDIDY
jgi:hypothetical protein